MSDREKEIIKTVADALPNMDDFQKGYFLGAAETLAQKKKQKQKNDEQEGKT